MFPKLKVIKSNENKKGSNTKNLSWVFGVDKKNCPSGSLFCITRQASRRNFQWPLGQMFLSPPNTPDSYSLQLFPITTVDTVFIWPEALGSWVSLQYRQALSSVSRPSVFKHLLLRNHQANQSQISCGGLMGWGNENLFKWSWSHAYMPYLTLWDKISQNLAHLEANSHKIFTSHRIFRPSFNTFCEEINLHHTLLCLSQTSYIIIKAYDYFWGASKWFL